MKVAFWDTGSLEQQLQEMGNNEIALTKGSSLWIITRCHDLHKEQLYMQLYDSPQWRHNERDGVSNHRRFRLFVQPFVQVQIKEKIKASRHWPLWEESTGDR